MEKLRTLCASLLLALCLSLCACQAAKQTGSAGEDASPAAAASLAEEEETTGVDAAQAPEEAEQPSVAADALDDAPTEDSAAQTAPAPSAEEVPSAPSATADENKPLSGAVICVDPGHCVTSEKRTEQVSPLSSERKNVFGGGTTGKTLTEEKLNLTVGLMLRDKLEELGATVVLTREVSEIAIDNVERAQMANDANADCCIRIHADGSNDSSVHGVSVLVPSGSQLGTPAIVEPSAALGKLMVNSVAEKTGAKNRGTVQRSDLVGFNWSEVPVVLIEMGFMTNPDEDALLSTADYQQKIVDGIAEAVVTWMEQS